MTAATSRSSLGLPALIGVVAALTVALAAIIATDSVSTSRAAQDQDNYHLRVARTFALQWPGIDFSDYRSATTPGYHLTLATVAKFISDDTQSLRAAGAFFTIGLVLTLGLAVTRAGVSLSPLLGAALILPLACSLYVFSAGAWILPDNAGWWGVLGILALIILRPATPGGLFIAGLILLVLVLCRQTHLWTAGLIWLWPWLDQARPSETAPAATARRRLTLGAMAVIATVPAFLAVAAFVSLWHGLVPPLFQGGAFDPVINETSPKNSGGNPATPAFLLTLFGIYGPFFLGYARSGITSLRARDRRTMLLVVAGLAIGLALALIPATSMNRDLGRYTGFWAIAAKLPTIADRSLFIAAGAAAGGAVLALFLVSLPRRDALLFLATLAGFTIAQSAAFAAWQRYLEPFVLIVLALMSARALTEPAPGFWRVARLHFPITLSLILIGITARSLRVPPARADTPVTYAPPTQIHFGKAR